MKYALFENWTIYLKHFFFFSLILHIIFYPLIIHFVSQINVVFVTLKIIGSAYQRNKLANLRQRAQTDDALCFVTFLIAFSIECSVLM